MEIVMQEAVSDDFLWFYSNGKARLGGFNEM